MGLTRSSANNFNDWVITCCQLQQLPRHPVLRTRVENITPEVKKSVLRRPRLAVLVDSTLKSSVS